MRVILFSLCLFFCGVAGASDCAVAKTSTGDFMVSGVLQKNGTTDVIKVVHGVERAATEDKALESFRDKAGAQYPGYGLLTALASPILLQAKTCRPEPTPKLRGMPV